ncbi:hypothetical protein [Salinicoccus roseus]|uniref:hypothetical protein n=1 Tax=Salinicoccus roseus TaxID=45670 RepID=UPI003DA14E11
MDYLYIDEKGPQETIRMTEPYEDEKKIKLGNDNMFVYVADVVKISEENLPIIEENYQLLENNYKSTRNFENEKELKGSSILKNNFKYGVASLKKRELKFYSSLMDILLENDISNLLFTINKMSLVADNRLTPWILELEKEDYIESARLIKYSLVKYLEIEASEKVIQTIFDSSKSNKQVITEIQKDLYDFIDKHRHNKRMKVQLLEYKKLRKLIKSKKYLIADYNYKEVSFDWSKVVFNIDLWFTELNYENKFAIESAEILLDEGIPLEPFNKFDSLMIKENQDSSNHVGLRISDVLVVFVGKYISNLASDVRYNKDRPDIRKILSELWFEINEEQFNLIKKIRKFFFPHNSKYCYIVDTYFDDALLWQTFINYVDSYSTFDSYMENTNKHADYHFGYLSELMHYKWYESLQEEVQIKNIYGSMKNAIESGVVRSI